MSVFDSSQPEQQQRDKEPWPTMADILALPDEAHTLLTWLLRQGEADLSEVAGLIKQDKAATSARLAELVAQGFVEVLDEGEEPRYRVRLASRRGRLVSDELSQNLSSGF